MRSCVSLSQDKCCKQMPLAIYVKTHPLTANAQLSARLSHVINEISEPHTIYNAFLDI